MRGSLRFSPGSSRRKFLGSLFKGSLSLCPTSLPLTFIFLAIKRRALLREDLFSICSGLP
ncbi:hypothetical protein N9157_02635 [Saprospiraceae bacterium]|nr:hypothetical protein [Saprospiraceae bacterium]